MNDQTYAGFWIRVWASLIDTFFTVILIMPLLWALYGDSYFTSDAVSHGTLDAILNYVFPALIVIVFWCYKSATPGKMICDLTIVDANTGSKPSTKQFVGRYLAYYLSALPFLLGFIWVAFDSRKQGWHDKLAGTVVLHKLPTVATFNNAAD
jgi:uncharacterized RDD family membrane protein YckC